MKGTDYNADTNLTVYLKYLKSSIKHMFNEHYLSTKYMKSSNIHKQLFSSKPQTNLNSNAKLLYYFSKLSAY